MHTTFKLFESVAGHRQHLIIVVSSFDNVLDVNHLESYQGPVYLIEIKCEILLFDYAIKFGKLIHYLFPMLSSYRVTHHVGMCHEEKEESLLETHIKASNHCGRTKLFSKSFYVIYLIPNSILSFKNK